MKRVAVVTGGASGIGAATAEELGARGCRVAVLDLAGGIDTDVSDPSSVTRSVEEVRGSLGPIDVLVNAAGIATGGSIEDDAYLDAWRQAIAVNLTGGMLMVRACVDDLLRDGRGRIVNIASTEGVGAGRGTGPYAVSKHGVVGFTRSLAVELGRRGVTANCVCPGATLTGMTGAIPETDRDTYARRHIPVGRYGRPQEIAHVIASLTDPGASFINGAVIPVDGGMTAASP